MAKHKRIPVNVTEEQEVLIHKLMKMENRSRAYISTMVFADGLKLVTDNIFFHLADEQTKA